MLEILQVLIVFISITITVYRLHKSETSSHPPSTPKRLYVLPTAPPCDTTGATTWVFFVAGITHLAFIIAVLAGV